MNDDKKNNEPTMEKTTEQTSVEQVFADENARAEGETASSDSPSPRSADDGLNTELADARRRVLLAQADLDNFRKRARRDAEESVKYAALPLIRDLLPTIDNLQRAIEAQISTEEGASDDAAVGMMQGVQMVSQQMLDVLAQHHCKVIDASGEFDPNVHQAVLQQPSAEYPSGMIIQVTQTGYQLHERVIRPAQVIVSKGPA